MPGPRAVVFVRDLCAREQPLAGPAQIKNAIYVCCMHRVGGASATSVSTGAIGCGGADEHDATA